MAILLIALLGISGGSILLRVGLRGRKIDDHPLCAQCGFDLTGMPQSSWRCSECGTNLRAPRAVQIGHRRRRKSWVVVGALLLLIAAAAISMSVAEESDPVRWAQNMPESLLLLQARTAGQNWRATALNELIRRARAGNLNRSQATDVVAAALEIQGDSSKTWDPRWGDLVEFEWFNKQVSNEQWARYGRQAFKNAFVLRVRPVVRLGDPMPYSLDVKPTRNATTSVLRVNFGIEFSDLWSDRSHDVPGLILSGFTATTSGSMGSALGANGFPDGIAPGLHRVRFTENVEDHQGRAVSALASGGSTVLELVADVTLQPPGKQSVRGTPNPQIADSVRRSLQSTLYYDPAAPGNYSSNIFANAPPVGLSFAVFAVVAGKEVKLGSLTCPAGATRGVGLDGYAAFGSLFPASQHTGGPRLSNKLRITLIFRSDPSPAINSTDVFDYWEGTIEMRDVPVTSP